MADDAHLLRRYAETRSEAAFAALVERHLGLVYHCALRRLGAEAHLAPDITQAVFVLLGERARSLCSHPSLAGWLHATTHFKVSETLRAEHRRRARETAAHLMHDILSDQPTAAEWERLRPVLDDVLLELNTADREAVLLRFFEGRPFAEIGERLALSDKGAHKRVERALEKLRDRLARRGITSTAAALGACLGAQAALAAPTGLAATVTSAALAAPVPAATAFVLLPLMTSTKTTVAAAMIVLGLAGTLAVHEVRAGRDAANTLLAASRETDTLLAQLRATQLRTRQAEADATALAASPARPRPAPAAAKADDDDSAGGVRDGRALLAAHPELRAALLADLSVMTRRQYAGLFAALGLTPAEIEEFVRIQAYATKRLVGQHAFTLGDDMPSGEEVTRQLRDLLGDAGYEQYRDFRRTAPAYALTETLAGSVYFTDTPLSAEQGNQFRQIMQAALDEPINGRRLESSAWVYLPPVIWERVLARAPSVLAPAQVAALRDLHQQAVFMQAQAGAASAYARDAAKAAATPPAK